MSGRDINRVSGTPELAVNDYSKKGLNNYWSIAYAQ